MFRGNKFKGQRSCGRGPSGKIKQVRRKSISTNACSLGNKQEELLLHVWTQNCELIGVTEEWWGNSRGWRSGREVAAPGETQARKKRTVVAFFGSEQFMVEGNLWEPALNVKAAVSVVGHQDGWGLEHVLRDKRLRIPAFFSMESRRLWRGLIANCQNP